MQENKNIKLNEIQAARSRLCHHVPSSLSLHHEIAQRLLDHLEGITIEPTRILDLGAGGNNLKSLLRQRFPKATIISTDVVPAFAKKQKKSWFKQQTSLDVCCLPGALPIPDNSIDLVISNLFLYWFEALPELFLEVRRVLKPNALFLFSTLGPDTLNELSPANQDDGFIFSDMHDIGDELMRGKFLNPVMDMEKLQFSYRQTSAMEQDLEDWQFHSWLPLHFKGDSAVNSLSFEIIYGHAWGPSLAAKSLLTKEGDIAIPIRQIPVKVKK